VLVENLDNGRSVVVRINDRGPFTHDRIIDVSKAAAEKLDMVVNGVANVRVRRLEGDVASIPAPR
jgi:rare lipoprotein A